MMATKTEDKKGFTIEELAVPEGARWQITPDDKSIELLLEDDTSFLHMTQYTSNSDPEDRGSVWVEYHAFPRGEIKERGYDMIYPDFIKAAQEITKAYEGRATAEGEDRPSSTDCDPNHPLTSRLRELVKKEDLHGAVMISFYGDKYAANSSAKTDTFGAALERLSAAILKAIDNGEYDHCLDGAK